MEGNSSVKFDSEKATEQTSTGKLPFIAKISFNVFEVIDFVAKCKKTDDIDILKILIHYCCT